MLELTKEVACRVMNDLDKYTYSKIKTTMISKYPESKQMRGLMKMENKQFDEQERMYRLTYSAEMTNNTIKEAYEKWLKKEMEYRKLKK